MTPLEHVREHESFARWFAKTFYRAHVRRVCELEDLEAVALAALWEAAVSWRDGEGRNFRSWAWRHILHALIKEKRYVSAAMRRGETLSLSADDDGEQVELPSPIANPEQALLAKQRAAEVQRKLGRLKPKKQAVIARVYWHGETLADAARAMGFSRERARQIKEEVFERLREPA